jgi:hypothetical protein
MLRAFLAVLLGFLLTTSPRPAHAESAATQGDDLVAWHSPVGHPLLTHGEYLALDPVASLKADVDGDGRPEELVAVPFDTPRGAAVSVAILKPAGRDYGCALLFSRYAADLERLNVYPLARGASPLILAAGRSGSGGFLELRAYRRARRVWKQVAGLEGVYQGQYRITCRARPRLTVLRAVPGEIDAAPRATWREVYEVGERRLALVRRSLTRHPVVRFGRRPNALPDAGPKVQLNLVAIRD